MVNPDTAPLTWAYAWHAIAFVLCLYIGPLLILAYLGSDAHARRMARVRRTHRRHEGHR